MMMGALIEWTVAARSVGDDESGDQFLVKPFAGGVLVAVVDGLGHGREAAAAARTAIAILEVHASEGIAPLLKRCHERLRLTRGVVLSIACFRAREGTMTWLGVGNVEGVLLRADRHRSVPERLVPRGGIVGHHLPAVEAACVPVVPGDTLVFATDGVGGGLAGALMTGLPRDLTAERIVAEHGTATDDALVVVARYRGRSER